MTVAQDLATLQRKHGSTHDIWTVPRAPGGGPTWHARRHNAAATETLHAAMPCELATLIYQALAEETIENALIVLRTEFDGTSWRFGTVWASAATSSVRRLTATRGAVLLAAEDAAEMRAKIARETAEEDREQ